MNARGHIISGGILLTDIYLADYVIQNNYSNLFISDILKQIDLHTNMFYDFNIIKIILCIACYFVGLILPDIDHPESFISKVLHFHIPIYHRGLTHTVYFAILFILLGLFLFMPLMYIGFGILLHGFMDHFSLSGWVPFYPLGSYTKKYHNVLKRHHYIYFYETGELSEIIFLISIGAVSVLFWFLFYLCVY